MFKDVFQYKWGVIVCFHSAFDHFYTTNTGSIYGNTDFPCKGQAEIFEDESSLVYKKKKKKNRTIQAK